MQFIVKKSQQNPFNFTSYRDFERKGLKWLIVLALVGCFSSGLLIGCLSNLDTSPAEAGPAACSQQISNTTDGLGDKDSTFLVVLILSAKDYENRRDSIRESWLRLVGGRRVKHYFAVGTLELDKDGLQKLDAENEKYRDLLLFSQVKDTYSGLTHKLLASLRAIGNRHSFDYLLKVDDDSFVRIDKLFDELVQRQDSTKLYWGYFVGNSQVKKVGKWAEKSWFLCDRYLPYAVGGGYVLSADLVNFVATNAHLMQLYNSEDVSMGTWLSALDIHRQHDQRFDTWFKSRGCSNEFLITHKQSIKDMRDKHECLESTGRLCRTERFTNGHIYDWKGLPSQCCGQTRPSKVL